MTGRPSRERSDAVPGESAEPLAASTGPDADVPSALRAFAHPLRLQIMSLLTGAAMSAAEVARELGTTQANASYHLRRLLAVGLLEVGEEVEIRGGRARRYRHDPGTGSRLRAARIEDHQMIAAAMAAELQRRSALRALGTAGALTDAELWVDQETWHVALTAVRDAMHLLHERAQAPRSAGALRISATVSLFCLAAESPASRPSATGSSASGPSASGPSASGPSAIGTAE